MRAGGSMPQRRVQCTVARCARLAQAGTDCAMLTVRSHALGLRTIAHTAAQGRASCRVRHPCGQCIASLRGLHRERCANPDVAQSGCCCTLRCDDRRRERAPDRFSGPAPRPNVPGRRRRRSRSGTASAAPARAITRANGTSAILLACAQRVLRFLARVCTSCARLVRNARARFRSRARLLKTRAWGVPILPPGHLRPDGNASCPAAQWRPARFRQHQP